MRAFYLRNLTFAVNLDDEVDGLTSLALEGESDEIIARAAIGESNVATAAVLRLINDLDLRDLGDVVACERSRIFDDTEPRVALLDVHAL